MSYSRSYDRKYECYSTTVFDTATIKCGNESLGIMDACDRLNKLDEKVELLEKENEKLKKSIKTLKKELEVLGNDNFNDKVLKLLSGM